MKLIKYALYLALFTPALLLSNTFLTEVRVGYFYPSSNTMRDIYHNGGIEYELEQSVYLCNNWMAWGNINYFNFNGHAKGCHGKTCIEGLPLSLGVKYSVYKCRALEFYLGAGGSYTYLRLHDHSPYVKQKSTKHSFGVVAKSGALYFINRHVFLDLYVDYYYSHVSGVKNNEDQIVYPKSQNIGGLRTGLGLGIAY